MIELNEAFSAQSIARIKELKIKEGSVNTYGGALALGHPLGGTGAILTAKLSHKLEHMNLSNGLISFCCGCEQGGTA